MNIESCMEELGLTKCFLIKEAGQKKVYSALSDNFGTVAVKIIRPNQNLNRIQREIDIVKNIPNLKAPKIFQHSVFECNEVKYFYIIEEFIHGKNLREYIEELKTIPCDEVCKFLKTIIDTICIMGGKSIVHRDIKPENIMRTVSGDFILIDFGIARDLSQESLTSTSSPGGPATIAYAPLEQIDYDKTKIDSRVDLYSVCLVAYEMLSGYNPFSKGCENHLQIIRKIDAGNFTRLKNDDYSDMLDFIHTNMNRYPTKRCANANEAKKWFDEIYKKLYQG